MFAMDSAHISKCVLMHTTRAEHQKHKLYYYTKSAAVADDQKSHCTRSLACNARYVHFVLGSSASKYNILNQIILACTARRRVASEAMSPVCLRTRAGSGIERAQFIVRLCLPAQTNAHENEKKTKSSHWTM